MKRRSPVRNKRKPSAKVIAELATFPVLNPNPVGEMDLDGRILYLNPAAKRLFPDLEKQGPAHPWLTDLDCALKPFREGRSNSTAREVQVGEQYYHQAMYLVMGTQHVRFYGYEITKRKRVEQALQASHDELERIVAERTAKLQAAYVQLRRLTQELVSAQEEERLRVSRELHDDAGQALTALKMSLQLTRDELPPGQKRLRERVDEALTLADTTIERIRMVAQDLRPPALDQAGLNPALEGLCRDFARRTQIRIEYVGTPLTEPSGPVSICLYRFLQEALTNAARHGHASCIDVHLQRDGRKLLLTVQDNGIGFDVKVGFDPARPPGTGLIGMQERLSMVGGWMEIESDLGRGTRLAAHVESI